MDVVAGTADGPKQGKEEVVAAGVDVYVVALEGQRPVLVDELLNECPVGIGQRQVLLLGKLQHRPLCQLVHALLADEALLARVLAEEDVEDEAHHGYERQHKNPRHGLCGLTVVHQDGDHGAYDKQGVDGEEYPVQVVQFLVESLEDDVASQFAGEGITHLRRVLELVHEFLQTVGIARDGGNLAADVLQPALQQVHAEV